MSSDKNAQSENAQPTEKVRYDGYKVYQVKFTSEEQFDLLYKMMITESEGIDFWRLARVDKSADIMIAPGKIEYFLSFLESNGFTYEVINENVQNSIDAEDASVAKYRNN